ncbi:hypothetical protein Tco_0945530, partial [Tanacetum coccineum]
MNTTKAQQKELDDALVAPENRLKIGKSNLRLSSNLKSKEPTLQVALDALKLTPFYNAFEISADVPEIYMQEFWVTITRHHSLLCQQFEEPILEEEILSFIRDLGHTGEIKFLSDVNVNHMHQPWRSFAAIINKYLSGKTTALESLRLSRAQLLWGMYHNKKVDCVYLLWEDLVFQLENNNSKKNNDMYYPRFTKVIVKYFMAKDQAIPRRNKMFWHYAMDDFMFTTTYRAYATGEKTPKSKSTKKKADSESSPKKKPTQASKGKRIKTLAKGDKPATTKSKGLTVLSEVALSEAEQMKLASSPNYQGCALWRKKLKEVWFTICHENGIYQDLLNTYKSSDDDTNVVNAPQEPFVVKQDPGENSSQSPSQIDHHCCYKCGDSLDDIFCQRCTSRYWKIPIYYDDDDDEESSIPLKDVIMSELPPYVAITPALSPEEPVDSLIMEDEHLDTIPEMESDEFIKSSVKDLAQIPSKSKDSSDGECDLPLYDDSLKNHDLTFSNPLFDIDEDFTLSDESFSKEDVPNENFKIFSNPLFDLDEEIIATEVNLIQNEVLESITSIPPGIDSFDVESNLIESLLNRNTSIDSSSKIDSLLDEFVGELTLLHSIPPGIDDVNLDPEGEIHPVERFLYDNSSPRPLEDSNSDVSDATTESFSPSPIPVEDSDSLMEEIDLFLTPDDSMPPGIKTDDYDSEGDILFFKELLTDDSLSLPKHESFHFESDYDPSSLRPSAKPPDDDEIEPDTGILTTKVVGDIFEHCVLIPRLLPTQPTLCLVIQTLLPFSSENVDKVYLLSHRGFKNSKLSFHKSPMLIHGDNTPNL